VDVCGCACFGFKRLSGVIVCVVSHWYEMLFDGREVFSLWFVSFSDCRGMSMTLLILRLDPEMRRVVRYR
jgi:hypothetical protein